MTEIRSSTQIDPGVERLLASLEGVYSAHVVAGPGGSLREIHILATPDLHPKQVVRNVESALSAGLGIEIDRRIVSVAQVRPDAVPEPSSAVPHVNGGPVAADEPEPDRTRTAPHESGRAPTDAAAARHAGHEAPPAPEFVPEPAPQPSDGLHDASHDASHGPGPARETRTILLGFDVRRDARHQATCRVTLRSGKESFVGAGQGPDTDRGRAESAARAVFAALDSIEAGHRLGLEAVDVVDAHGRRYVLVAARTLDDRRPIPLTGAAIIDRSPEEAAIMASLQATNRWRAAL